MYGFLLKLFDLYCFYCFVFYIFAFLNDFITVINKRFINEFIERIVIRETAGVRGFQEKKSDKQKALLVACFRGKLTTWFFPALSSVATGVE